jgi:hypothetical protein
MITLLKILFGKEHNLYNIDYVGAKTGKHLTDKEKVIQYWGNWIPTKLTLLGIITFSIFMILTLFKLILLIWTL